MSVLTPRPPTKVAEDLGVTLKRPRRRRRFNGRTVAIGVIVAAVLYLVLGPLLMLTFASFKDTRGSLPFESGVPWTLKNFETVLLSGGTYSVLWTTVVYAAGALLLSFSVALMLAWFVERTDMPGRGFVSVMVIASIGLPGVISGIAWTLLLSPRSGMINAFLQALFGLEGEGPLNVYTLWGMIFVQAVTLVPITYLLVAAGFKASDAGVEEAGSTSGARFSRVIRKITLPLLAPALLSALVYQFVSVIESFDIPLVVGLPAGIRVLSTEIYTQAVPAAGLPNYGQSAAYAILLIALALGPLLIYNKVIKHSDRYATLSGHSHRSRRFSLGRWRWAAFAASLAVIFVIFILPALVMVWTSLQPYYANPSAEAFGRMNLGAFEKIFGSSSFWDTMRNTFVLATATAFATMVLGLLVSWILVRTRSRLRTPLDVVAFTPHAMPGVIIAISILLLYVLLPGPIDGTIWIIVIALTTQWLALSSRLMTGGIAQIRADLEEVAATSGASWGMTMRKIVLPLVLPAFLNGFVLIFLMGIKNLTIPLVLVTPGTNVLATRVWAAWENGETAQTAAMGVVMVTITLTLALVHRMKKGSFVDRL